MICLNSSVDLEELLLWFPEKAAPPIGQEKKNLFITSSIINKMFWKWSDSLETATSSELSLFAPNLSFAGLSSWFVCLAADPAECNTLPLTVCWTPATVSWTSVDFWVLCD